MKKNYALLFFILLFFAMSQAQTTWKNVQIGGGGFVTGIITSKTEADLKYARTDVGGAYRWDATNAKWISLLDWVSTDQVGYMGVEAIAIDPQNNDTVYLLVGTDYFNSGKTAILKSTDRGNTFTETIVTSQFKAHGNGMGRSNGERLVVDPNNSNILFCGTRRNGLFKSIDGGATWTNIAGFPATTTTNDNGICFVELDPSTASGGSTQTLYAGVSRTGAANLYKSADGGTTWTAVAGASTTFMPQRAVLDSNGTLLLTYADKEGPWNSADGQIWKLSKTGVLTNITPTGFAKPFGGIDVDPTNPQRLVASTMNTYLLQYTPSGGSGIYGDRFFLSSDGGSTWRDLVGSSGITINDNGCTWISGASASIHWAGDIKFNPFDTTQASVISGNGIFTCTNLNAAQTTWKFDAIGLEETVPLDLISIPNGPVMSVIGDYDGFKHSNVAAFAPQHAPAMGTSTSITYAAGNTNKVVRLGDKMYYSIDQGGTWTQTTGALMGKKGRVALSYDGTKILHCPSGSNITYRTVSNGNAWTTCTGLSFSDVVPVSDQVTNNKFYAYNNSTGDMMVSTNGGSSFAIAGNAGTSGSKIIRTVPGNANHIWIAMNGNGLKRSIDGGVTFTIPSANVTAATSVGIGAAAPGVTYPTVYIWGTVSGITGVFRSIDQGATWIRVNDDAHEYGGVGNGQFVIGDMNTYGRVYMSTVGRGIVYGDSDATLGLGDLSNKSEKRMSISVYPNPVKENYIQVQLPDATNSSLVTVQIFDVAGKLLIQEIYSVINNNITVLLDGKAKGILVLKVKTSDGKFGVVKVLQQ